MAMRILAIIGLIGGIIALVGIFTPWATGGVLDPLGGEWIPKSASAWDGIKDSAVSYFTLALVGVCIALLGALSALAAPRVKALWAMLAIGGILAIAGAAYGFFDIDTGPGWTLIPSIGDIPACSSYGYGLSLTLVGGILALIGALVGGILALTGALGSKE
jgi:hypothetical protein